MNCWRYRSPNSEIGKFELLAIFEDSVTVAQLNGIGVSRAHVSNAVFYALSLDRGISQRDHVNRDADQVETGDCEQATHPQAVDELLAIPFAKLRDRQI